MTEQEDIKQFYEAQEKCFKELEKVLCLVWFDKEGNKHRIPLKLT